MESSVWSGNNLMLGSISSTEFSKYATSRRLLRGSLRVLVQLPIPVRKLEFAQVKPLIRVKSEGVEAKEVHELALPLEAPVGKAMHAADLTEAVGLSLGAEAVFWHLIKARGQQKLKVRVLVGRDGHAAGFEAD